MSATDVATSNDLRWWLADKDVAYVYARAAVERIHSDQDERSRELVQNARLYGGGLPHGCLPVYARSVTGGNASRSARLSLNVVRSMVDAVQAEVILTKPRPQFLTSDGDFDLRQRAEKLGKFCEGAFYKARVDEVASEVARDAEVFGTGVAKVFEHDGDVCVERIFPGEVYVDEVDGVYRKPRSMYQTKYYDRSVLRDMYPERADEIDAAPAPSGDWSIGYSPVLDQVLVTEAWRLPSSKKAKDGRHIICIDTTALVDEPWEDAGFPFVFLHWSLELVGFWGKGLASELQQIQFEINRLLRDIQRAQYLCGTFRIFAPAGSIAASATNNETGTVVFYKGNVAPQWVTAVAVPPELYAQLDRLYAKAFEIAGVSQLSAQSMKPAGLDSGRALRAFADIQSKRFLRFGRGYEQWHIDVATQMVALMRRIAKRAAENDNDEHSVDVVYRAKDHIERIHWKDVELEESEYVMQCFPVSALPNTPAGRLAAIQEMINSGFAEKLGWGPEEIGALLDFPDLDAGMSLALAPLKLAQETVSKILAEGEAIEPEPFFDLALHMHIGVLSYQRAIHDGVPEERIDLLRVYLEKCKDALASANATPPAPAAPPGAPPLPPGPSGPPPADGQGAPIPPPQQAA